MLLDSKNRPTPVRIGGAEKKPSIPTIVGDQSTLNGQFSVAGQSYHTHLGGYPQSSQNSVVTLKKNESVLFFEGPGLTAAISKVKRYASSDLNILLQAKTGAGKDVLARMVHELSGRQGEFILVNCPSVPLEMFESEFFGHKKGAFTGAIRNHKGFFEQAHKGTLFLNEIGKTPLWYQAKLLTVIETKRVRPLGSEEELTVDVRLITASNIDLMILVANGEFFEDFYYRIAKVTIRIPPLRERLEDIAPLTRYFLQVYSKRYNKPVPTLSFDVVVSLLSHRWPGNVRELEDLIHRAVYESGEGETIQDLILSLLGEQYPAQQSLRERRDAYETQLVKEALRDSSSDREAATKLRIKPRTLDSVKTRLRIASEAVWSEAKTEKSL